MKTINLSARDLEILRAALPVHLKDQLPGEDTGPAHAARTVVARQLLTLVNDMPPAPLRVPFSDAEAYELSEAVDSYIYWHVSTMDERDDGYVSSDRPEVVEAQLLGHRLGAGVDTEDDSCPRCGSSHAVPFTSPDGSVFCADCAPRYLRGE